MYNLRAVLYFRPAAVFSVEKTEKNNGASRHKNRIQFSPQFFTVREYFNQVHLQLNPQSKNLWLNLCNVYRNGTVIENASIIQCWIRSSLLTNCISDIIYR